MTDATEFFFMYAISDATETKGVF